MLRSSELNKIPIFACLNDANLVWLSQQAADIHLEPGEYLIHEGEPTPFFVVMEGTTEVLKDVMGRQTDVSEHNRGDFFGELPILMATASPASVRAKTSCHLARLDPQHLQELIRRSPECSALILQTLNERVQAVQKYMLNLPSSRVQIVGSKFDDGCREIRTFLSMNRIPYKWVDRDRSAQLVLADPVCDVAGLSVVVDGTFCVSHPPTVRKVAEALGFQTAPHRQNYDVVIIGGGPAGLAAAVYGASEGLSVLLVERRAPGGQAGTSSGIENYLGFPNASQERTSVNARLGRRLSLEPKWFLPGKSRRSFRNPMAHIRLGSLVAIGLTQRPSSWRPESIGAGSRRWVSIASSDVASCMGLHVRRRQLWQESASLLSAAATLPARLHYSSQITQVQ